METITESRGPYGNSGPPNWNLQLASRQRIRGINIRSGDIVDGIEFVVAGEDGRPTIRRFGGGGGSFHEISFGPNEYIAEISGRHGFYEVSQIFLVASITIRTNLQSYGPFGEARRCRDTGEFTMSLPSGSELTGLFGKQGGYLESIGAYIKRDTTLKLGPWGSTYPLNWDLHLGPGDRIKEIIIHSGYIVDGIGFIVEDSHGERTTKKFAGTGGGTHTIQLRPNEYITDLSGRYGRYGVTRRYHISSIKMHTNLNRDGYGLYGSDGDCTDVREFSSSIPVGRVIVGFFGRGDGYMESIGVYTKKVD